MGYEQTNHRISLNMIIAGRRGRESGSCGDPGGSTIKTFSTDFSISITVKYNEANKYNK